MGRCVSPQGRPACTRYCVLAAGPGRFLAACALGTGRTHQIRVHFSHAGYPLLGDWLYGGDTAALGRPALHCGVLQFTTPAGGPTGPAAVQAFAPIWPPWPRRWRPAARCPGSLARRKPLPACGTGCAEM